MTILKAYETIKESTKGKIPQFYFQIIGEVLIARGSRFFKSRWRSFSVCEIKSFTDATDDLRFLISSDKHIDAETQDMFLSNVS